VSERRALPDRRQRGLRLVPVELPAPPEEAPFLRPNRRTRVRRSRRGWAWRAVLMVEAVGGALVLVCAGWASYARVMASERLRVDRVEVRGSHFLSEGEVREMLGPAVGVNILGLDIDGLKSRLRSSPWVAEATVARTLPDTLRVEIREREPLALAELERLYLMDGDGSLIDLYGPRTAGFDLPIVRGLAGTSGEARRDRAQRAGTLLRDLGDLAREVSELEVEPSGDLRLVLRGAGEVVRMGPPPWRDRFLTFLGLRKELAARCPDTEYFDLRYRDRIFAKQRAAPPVAASVTPAPGGPKPPAARAAAPAPDEPAEDAAPPPAAHDEVKGR
jgi:cell division septal protein FtsQ